MADVTSLQDAARRKARRDRADRQQQARGRTLCGRGFHKWQIDKARQFDVRRGRLVTLHRCARCGASKTTLE
ncbi:MAG: hypothetical protein R3E86_13320 [Pseudomonadales bacterium]